MQLAAGKGEIAEEERLAEPLPRVTERVWGLDLGRGSLKALQMGYDPESGRVVALGFDLFEYPEVQGRARPEAEPALTAAIQAFLDRNDIEGCKIAVSATGRAGLVRFVEVPAVKPKQLRAVVAYEAALQIPLALQKVIWDYQAIVPMQELPGPDPVMAEVGLVALTREQAEMALRPFKDAGLAVDVLQLEPVALTNFATFDQHDELADTEGLVLLDMGTNSTGLIVLYGRRFWWRDVPIGGRHFTDAIARRLNLGPAKAEHLKRNLSRLEDPQAAFAAMNSAYEDFIREVERSIGFFSKVHPQVRVGRTLTLGNGFLLPGLHKLLPLDLGPGVEKLGRFARLIGDEVVEAPMFRENRATFAVAYGLGIQALGLGRWGANLLAPEDRPRRRWSLGGLFRRQGRS